MHKRISSNSNIRQEESVEFSKLAMNKLAKEVLEEIKISFDTVDISLY